MIKAVCFGEILWDVFPAGKQIGGAPFNVARQMGQNGFDCKLISAIGYDDFGMEILGTLESINFSSEGIQQKTNFPTGTVIITLDTSGSATYDISKPVAWDAISINSENRTMVSESDVFVFGSLASRSQVSRTTLLKFLKLASFKVFDANLRPPYYKLEDLELFMGHSDFIKLNEEELDIVTSTHKKVLSVEGKILLIYEIYNPIYIAVTLGKNGALLYCDNQFFSNKGYSIKVKDTVGAGDAFLATLVSELKKSRVPQSALDRACAIGALVASKAGANPNISENEISRMLHM